MTLQDARTIVWRRRWIVLLVTIIGAAAAWAVGGSPEPVDATYTGETTLTLAAGEDPRSVELYSYIANETYEIAVLVEEDLGEGVPGYVDIVPLSAIGAMRITAGEQPSEDMARAVVGLYADQISGYGAGRRIIDRDERLARLARLEAELKDSIEVLDRELRVLESTAATPDNPGRQRSDQLKETELAAVSDALAAVLREQAELNSQTDDDLMPLEPLGTITVQSESLSADPLGSRGRMAVGVALGSVLGIGLAFGLHRFDARLFTRRDAEVAYSLPVLAEIPKIPWRRRRGNQIITKENPTDKSAEAYRVLRSGIARARAIQQTELDGATAEGGTVLLVTSASAAVGKTTTVANLAMAAVDAGSTVLVVSADLRQPNIHLYFNVDPAALGLTDAAAALRRGYHVDLDDYVVGSTVLGISYLPHGSGVVNPGETLAEARPLIEGARLAYDLVILDSPPMLAGNDVDELLPVADLVVQVARAGRTTIEEGLWTDETIQRHQTPVCGLVLIGARSDLERRSSARRTGLRSRLANLFRRPFRQTGKIARGAKSLPQLPTPPPIETPDSVAERPVPSIEEAAATTTTIAAPDAGGETETPLETETQAGAQPAQDTDGDSETDGESTVSPAPQMVEGSDGPLVPTFAAAVTREIDAQFWLEIPGPMRDDVAAQAEAEHGATTNGTADAVLTEDRAADEVAVEDAAAEDTAAEGGTAQDELVETDPAGHDAAPEATDDEDTATGDTDDGNTATATDATDADTGTDDTDAEDTAVENSGSDATAAENGKAHHGSPENGSDPTNVGTEADDLEPADAAKTIELPPEITSESFLSPLKRRARER